MTGIGCIETDTPGGYRSNWNGKLNQAILLRRNGEPLRPTFLEGVCGTGGIPVVL